MRCRLCAGPWSEPTGHVFQAGGKPVALCGPCARDFYAFVKSQESRRLQRSRVRGVPPEPLYKGKKR